MECSFPLKLIFLPTLFDDAIKNNSSIGNCFFSKTPKSFLPTFPVAPIIAIFIFDI